MKKFVGDLSPFLWVVFPFYIIALALMLWMDRSQLHLFLNGFHSSPADFFFKYFTHIGDGVFPAIALPIVLVLYRKDILSNFVMGALTFLLVPASVQFFKRVVFPKSPRPVRVLGEDALYLVPDVEMAHIHTFPSGHATTIFALFIFLAYLFRRHQWMPAAFGVCAVLGAYSRVYLSQHFVQDIVAGSFLGMSCFFIAYLVVGQIFRSTRQSS
ncbi:MAG: phosphatase PAP2 family protein [Cyclobacteriaceae bacterium]